LLGEDDKTVSFSKQMEWPDFYIQFSKVNMPLRVTGIDVQRSDIKLLKNESLKSAPDTR
jgi:hypothetical protein